MIQNILLEVTGRLPHPEEPSGRRETVGRLRGQVLLAEDNLVNQQVAMAMLIELGIGVDAVGDGQSALDALDRRSFDLILMDCHMPVLDGMEATRTLRLREANDGIPRTPVVAMTANAMLGDRELCLVAGMDDYIPKPLSLRTLYAALSRWLPRGEGSSALEPIDQTQSYATIDPGTLTALREIMDEDFAALLNAYLREAPRLLARIEQATLDNDAQGLHLAAHSLKSSSATLGGTRLSELAAQMEAIGRAGQTEGAATLAEHSREELAHVVEALSVELQR